MSKTVNILLVEDEVITAMVMQSQLENLGYCVIDHVTTGENAIISAKENQPDIILMDIALAGEIDGIDAAIAIKSESDIPVIFITGYEDQQYKERAEKIKPLEYLIKPLNMKKLKSIIDSCFK